MLLRMLGLIGSALLIAIGVIHIASTPWVFGPPSDAAAWFAGAGLALVFSALINLVVRRYSTEDRFAWWVQQVVNGFTVWIAGFVVTQLPGAVSLLVLTAAMLQAVAGVTRGWGRRQAPVG